MRFIDESLGNTQANCVDGTVLFASVLRKIGIEPSLVTVPGHMFLGFDLNEAGTGQAYLETTLLGAEPGQFRVKNTALSRSLRATGHNADPLSSSGKETKKITIERFVAALQTGGNTFIDNKPAIEPRQPDYSTVRVSEARRVGILPILYVGRSAADR